MTKNLGLGAVALALVACSSATPAPVAPEGAEATEAPASATAQSIDTVLEAQPDEAKARYSARHPKETLEFFGVKPGMTVVDTLPGDVWYTGLLLDYLGAEGKVIAADYSAEMWTKFGDYTPDPKTKANWPADTVAKFDAKRGEDDAAIGAFQYGGVPAEMAGTADVVLVVRALHHFHRLEADGGYMTQAIADMKEVLKPGGFVGVVQHRSPETNSDEWAAGDKGYLKQTAVIAAFEAAGFELVEKSEVNANAKDVPTEEDIVWRLSPSLATSQGNDELKAKMQEIGESDRMTLKFRKPS